MQLGFDQGELFEHLEHMLWCPKTHVMIDVTRGHFRQIVDLREYADTCNKSHSLRAAYSLSQDRLTQRSTSVVTNIRMSLVRISPT
jgi:hypothetical protein